MPEESVDAERPTALPPDAVVIRAGQNMTVLHLTDALNDHAKILRERGLPVEYALSVSCVPGLTVDEVARKARHRHAMMRLTTVGQLEDAGFEVVPTPGSERGHCDVFLRDGREKCPNGIHLARFTEVFSRPRRNTGRPRGRQ